MIRCGVSYDIVGLDGCVYREVVIVNVSLSYHGNAAATEKQYITMNK